VNTTDFFKDIQKGKVGEQIFKNDFLDFLDIDYIDVTNCQQFQAIDADFKAKIGLYEIKANYKDDKMLCIEEYTNCNKEYGPISYGWFYKSGADLLVFLSKATRIMVMVPLTPEFKQHYENVRNEYDLIKNRVSTKGKNRWQSAFRKIPLNSIKGFYSVYKRISYDK